MTDAEDESTARRVLARFANSFDLRDWDALGDCLTDNVHTDYSDLRGTPAETLSRERFVDLRRAALQQLCTHHLSGNVEIALAGGRGEATMSMMIYRRAPNGRTFDSHCVYLFGLTRTAGGWRISSIVQKVLWSEGEAAVHPGGAKP